MFFDLWFLMHPRYDEDCLGLDLQIMAYWVRVPPASNLKHLARRHL